MKSVMKNKKIIQLLTFWAFSLLSTSALAFACKVNSTGQIVGVGTANVYVNLTPTLGVGQSLVVDLASQIECKNDTAPPNLDTDYIKLTVGSAYAGALSNLKGTVYWDGSTYPMPLNSDTGNIVITDGSYRGLPFRLYLTAVGAAGGNGIRAGELIAVIKMYKIATFGDGDPRNFTWNIYANNKVVIPTGGCDVSARKVNVTLPDYPGTSAVPLTAKCAQNQNLAYYLTGTTTDTNNTIFLNSASSNPAKGVGVQLSNRNGILATNKNISLGTVGSNSPVSLELTASYAQTLGQVVAGNVQSIIGVTFVYE